MDQEWKYIHRKGGPRSYEHIFCKSDSDECIKRFCWLEFNNDDMSISWPCEETKIRKSEIAKLKD